MSNIVNLMGEVQKLLEKSTLGEALSDSALSGIVERIKRMQEEIAILEKSNEKLTKELSDTKDKLSTEKAKFDELNKLYKPLLKREEGIKEAEAGMMAASLRNEMLEQQVEFLMKQNEMILRNAEIKKTINSVTPVVLPPSHVAVDSHGIPTYGTPAMVENHNTSQTTTEEQS